ncbi:TetR/AcrR family transcriptional regulator [Rhizorhapis sp. SPR117]|uniref:TetR/AcrR family transcriptional regulator n=1 Tax=Rhizorhapis sp. SPR117 TaxID=2912611 RepID=UPI001F2C943E|nr:TetR/AcrR family transcriptional regulator [Rhizorhapis sp. SPR117]
MVSRKNVSGEAPRERIISVARKLFGAKGFHATTTNELATESSVSIGQVYRLFTSKDDIVLAIVAENSRRRVEQMHAIFDAVERKECSIFEAIKAIAGISLMRDDGELSFEILAEACRNPSVADRLEMMTAFYREGIRRLAALARPDVPSEELEAYIDVMMACFIGLGHRVAIAPNADTESTSIRTACIMMRALGLPYPG